MWFPLPTVAPPFSIHRHHPRVPPAGAFVQSLLSEFGCLLLSPCSSPCPNLPLPFPFTATTPRPTRRSVRPVVVVPVCFSASLWLHLFLPFPSRRSRGFRDLPLGESDPEENRSGKSKLNERSRTPISLLGVLKALVKPVDPLEFSKHVLTDNIMQYVTVTPRTPTHLPPPRNTVRRFASPKNAKNADVQALG